MAQSGGAVCDDALECLLEPLSNDDGVITKKTEKTKAGVNEKDMMVLNNVREFLKCPVCTTVLSPPIIQCRNGHTLCSTCKTRLQSCCPDCGNEIGRIRCLALEKLAEVLKLPCKPSYKETLTKVANIHIQKE